MRIKRNFRLNLVRDRWPGFFDEIGRPFSSYLKGNGVISSYYVELGDNSLFFTFYFPTDENVSILKHFLRFFKPSHSDFASECIRLSIRAVSEDRLQAAPFESRFYFEEELSDIIMTIIANRQTLDDEFFLSLALHLHLVWIRTRIMICRESITSVLLAGYCWSVPPSKVDSDIARLELMYNGSRQELVKLYCALVHGNSNDLGEMPWLQFWSIVCSQKLKESIVKYFSQEHVLEITYHLAPYQLSRQMGLSKDTVLLLSYYINQAAIDSRSWIHT